MVVTGGAKMGALCRNLSVDELLRGVELIELPVSEHLLRAFRDMSYLER